MIILGTNSIKETGFNVANSLRFNTASSDHLSRTLGTPTNNKKWTYSAWVKKSGFDGNQALLSSGADANNRGLIYLANNGRLFLYETTSGTDTTEIGTNRVFRDVSSWMHIVVAVDTSQGTEANRVKIHVNGTQETSINPSNYPSVNAGNFINSAVRHDISGRNNHSTSDLYFNGYMAEVCFIDGQQLAPDQFGEFDEDSGIWKPKNVSGLTFGTNGFYLDFEDSSALGNDANGSNNFTVSNLTAIDQSTDTCTNNFCTMNPLDNFYSAATFSEGNIKISSSRYAGVTSTFALTKGKWYFEYKCVSRSGTSGFVGITSATATATNYEFGNQGGENVGYSVSLHNGSVYGNSSQVAASGTFETINGGDFGMVALDFDNNKMYFGKNGTWGNSQNPANGTNALSIVAVTQGASGHWRIYVGGETNNATVFEMNFGSPPYAISSGNTDGDGYGNFEYAVPSGYYSLNSKNLSEYG